jgi:hypothetical protein
MVQRVISYPLEGASTFSAMSPTAKKKESGWKHAPVLAGIPVARGSGSTPPVERDAQVKTPEGPGRAAAFTQLPEGWWARVELESGGHWLGPARVLKVTAGGPNGHKGSGRRKSRQRSA